MVNINGIWDGIWWDNGNTLLLQMFELDNNWRSSLARTRQSKGKCKGSQVPGCSSKVCSTWTSLNQLDGATVETPPSHLEPPSHSPAASPREKVRRLKPGCFDGCEPDEQCNLCGLCHLLCEVHAGCVCEEQYEEQEPHPRQMLFSLSVKCAKEQATWDSSKKHFFLSIAFHKYCSILFADCLDNHCWWSP